MSKEEERIGLGKLSLGLAIGGIIVPLLIAIIGVFLGKNVALLALLLIGVSEVIALILGIIEAVPQLVTVRCKTCHAEERAAFSYTPQNQLHLTLCRMQSLKNLRGGLRCALLYRYRSTAKSIAPCRMHVQKKLRGGLRGDMRGWHQKCWL